MDDEAATVNLPNDLGRVNRASTQSAVKLQEIGPRMTLQLVKVEEGLCTGAVIFSEYGTLISCIIVSPLTYQRNICHDLIRGLNQCLSDGRFINVLNYLHCSSFGGQKSVLEFFFPFSLRLFSYDAIYDSVFWTIKKSTRKNEFLASFECKISMNRVGPTCLPFLPQLVFPKNFSCRKPIILCGNIISQPVSSAIELYFSFLFVK